MLLMGCDPLNYVESMQPRLSFALGQSVEAGGGGGSQVLRDTQPTLRKPPTCAPFTSSCVNPMNYCSACIFLFLQAPYRVLASTCAKNNCQVLQP